MRTSGSHSRRNDKAAAAKPARARPAARAAATRSAAPRNGTHKFEIRSDFLAGRDVQKAILDDVARHRYSEHASFAIKLALEEALINAIKHGNKFDPVKKVRVTATVTDAECRIEVEDEGPGFNRKRVPDPCAEENLDKCSGRGILLMESYMNSVAWDRGGRRVRMLKKNEPDVLPRK